MTATQLAIAGGFSGFLTTSVMAPGERIKCILQVQQAATGPPKYDGPIHVIKVKSTLLIFKLLWLFLLI